MKKRLVFILVILIAIISSCQKDTLPPDKVPEDRVYYPMETGKYLIYDVDSIVYNSFYGTVDSFHYQIQELYDSTFADASGNQAFKISRSMRSNDSDAWKLTDAWFADYSANLVEKVEENLRFIKLNLPVLLNKYWYGNAEILIDSTTQYLADWTYRYTEVNVPLQLNGLTFDSTVTVLQQDVDNAIQHYYYVEKYAKHVGMIYKEADNVETQPGAFPNGTKFRMTIKEHN